MRFSGQLLKARRLEAGKRLEEVAFESRLSYPALAHYEGGRRFPSAATIGRLAEVLHCQPGDFYDPTQAAHELIRRTAVERGLPEQVTDPEALSQVAGVVAGAGRAAS